LCCLNFENVATVNLPIENFDSSQGQQRAVMFAKTVIVKHKNVMHLSVFWWVKLQCVFTWWLKNHLSLFVTKSSCSYATRSDLCFNKMMLLHVSWTGFVISVLGFEIIMTDDVTEALRFGMHLAGWLGMLYVVCHYGQTLMDEVKKLSQCCHVGMTH
jgi:hypothetical protein